MQRNELACLLARKTGQDNFLQYSISPFQRKHALDFAAALRSASSTNLNTDIAGRFGEKHVTVTESGRAALELALRQLELDPNDEIWIETTTNNFYISGCVTRTIEKFCRWSRERSVKTRAILVNHEFGFPVEDTSRYRETGLPVIEDCAFSFLSDNSEKSLGLEADYVVVSFPKFLPVPWGGALYCKKEPAIPGEQPEEVLLPLVNHYAADLFDIRAARVANFANLKARFEAHGFDTTFELGAHHTPGVFMFNTGMDASALASVKQDLNAAGIQSSVFYGRDAYFIPCHHELQDFDLEYLAEKTLLTIRKWQ